MLEDLRIDSFERLKDSPFRIVVADGMTVDTRLNTVTPLGDSGSRQAFSLIFHAPLEAPVLPQSIYRFEQPEIGPLEMFAVPLGPDRGVFRYEVIFT